jgi:TnpA family transposase
MTDTAGTSDIIFGLFWLLGYQFSPGLPMPVKRYSGEWINRQITVHWTNWRGCADLSKAEDQWDEMMRPPVR